jgi:hypothetical protein
MTINLVDLKERLAVADTIGTWALSTEERDFLLHAINRRELVRRLVKETPFTPSRAGLDLHVSFELMRELQEAAKP